MPFTSSPYTQNDYQSASTYRPYQLPVNQIAQASMALDEYWTKGAQRVKNVYDNALDLKLTNEQNKEIRDQYMKDASKQITKLSAMDLSNPSVQRQGIDIFKPLFQDEGIVSDDAATRHIEKVNGDALSYRSENNGKGYSYYNHEYALTGADEFKNSKDRLAGKQYLKQAKEYEPFYDYIDDYTKALKDCHPSSSTTQSPYYDNGQMTGYQKFNEVKGLSAEQVQTCLQGGMSEKGLRQLQIEGAVSYRNNKPVLAEDVSSYLSTVSGNNSKQLQELSAQKTHIRESTEIDDASKPVLLRVLDGQISQLTDGINKNNSIITKLGKGDYSPIDENYDSYAGSVYTYRKLLKKSLGASYSENQLKTVADPVQMQHLKFQQDIVMQNLDNNFQVGIEQMKEEHDNQIEMMKLLNTEEKKGSSFSAKFLLGHPDQLQWQTSNITQKPEDQGNVYATLKTKVDAFKAQDGSNNLELYNTVVSRADKPSEKQFRDELLKGFNYGTSDQDWTNFKRDHGNNTFGITANGGATGGLEQTSWFKAYFPLNKDNDVFNTWASKNSEINIGLQTLTKKIDMAESQVFSDLRPKGSTATDVNQLIQDRLKDVHPVTVTIKGKNVTITPQDIIDARNGRSRIGLSSSTRTISGSAGSPSLGIPSEGYRTEDFFLNGVPLDLSPKGMTGSINPLIDLRNKVDARASDVVDKINKKRAEIYNTLGFNKESWAITPDSKSSTLQAIRDKFPITTSNGMKPNDLITIQASDFSGGMKINHPDVSASDLDTYRSLGVGITAELGDKNTVILKGTNYNVVPQAINNPVMKDVAYQLSTIGATRDFASTQLGQKVPNSDIKIPVWIAGKRQTATIETYNSGGSPKFEIYLEGANTGAPTATANNAYDLLEKLSRLPISLNQPNK